MTTTRPASSRKAGLRLTLLALSLAAAAMAAHADDLRHDFLKLDDPLYLQASPVTLQGLTPGGVRFALTDITHGDSWVPLAKLSHMVDVQLWGLDPRGHHLTNLLLHAASAALLFLAIYRLTGSLGPAYAVGSLLAVHPAHVESVAWVAERRDVLSMFFATLTLLAYARYARLRSEFKVQSSELRQKGAGSSTLNLELGTWNYFLVLAAFAAALMSKPMMVTLPCVLLLLDYWPLRRAESFRRLLLEKLPLLAMTAGVAAITVKAQRPAIAGLSFAPLSIRIANVPAFYARYLGMLVWPVDLSPFYPYQLLEPVGAIIGGAALLGAVTIAAFLLRQRFPYLLVGWLWFLGTMVPVIGLTQSGPQAVACRFTYLPFVGLYVALAFLAAAALRRTHPVLPAVAGAAVVLLLGVLTYQLSLRWHNSLTLFTYALGVAPDNALAEGIVGLGMAQAGFPEQATDYNMRSLAFDLHDGRVLILQAAIDLNAGRLDRARSLLGMAARWDPGNPNLPPLLADLQAVLPGRGPPATSP